MYVLFIILYLPTAFFENSLQTRTLRRFLYFSILLHLLFCSVTVVTLSTGRTLLIINGYTFKEEYCAEEDTRWPRWVCSEPTNSKCDVYVHVNDKYEVVLMANAHTHEPIFCRLFQDRIM